MAAIKDINFYLYEATFYTLNLMKITGLDEEHALQLKDDIDSRGLQGICGWLPEVQYRILKSYCDYYEKT
jgi:hypothetical protein